MLAKKIKNLRLKRFPVNYTPIFRKLLLSVVYIFFNAVIRVDNCSEQEKK